MKSSKVRSQDVPLEKRFALKFAAPRRADAG
jgi:hypothetical protein